MIRCFFGGGGLVRSCQVLTGRCFGLKKLMVLHLKPLRASYDLMCFFCTILRHINGRHVGQLAIRKSTTLKWRSLNCTFTPQESFERVKIL